MGAKEFAAMITGREIDEELTPSDERQAEQSRLVVVFGYSDDNAEFRGAIDGEVGCYDGGDIYLTKNGIMQVPDCAEGDCPLFANIKEKARLIKAIWHNKGGPCWTYETDIPHETFEVYEDGELFCVGIVFSTDAL